MQAESSNKNTFFGDLWEIAKEGYRVLFGEPASVSRAPTPISTAAKPAVTQTVPKADPVVVVKIKPLDLTGDDDVTTKSPAEEQLNKEMKIKNNALTFQYFRSLDIKENQASEASLIKTGSKDLPFKIRSQAYEKYKGKVKTLALQKLITLIPDIESDRLLRGRWLSDKEVNHYMKLLVLKNPGTYAIDSLSFAVNNYCQRLASKAEAQAIRAANRVILPVCKDKHWHVVFVDKCENNTYNISYLDSLGYKDSTIIDKVKEMLTALYPDRAIDSLVNETRYISVPKQHNLDDCGVAVCYWANEIIEKGAMPVSEKGNCDYSPYRYEIADIFAKAHANKLRTPIEIEDDAPVATESVKILDVWKRKNKL